MFTGLYPHQPGAVVNGVPVAAGVPTLAEVLRDQGFRTGAFVSGFTMESKVSGLDRDFEVYDDELGGIRRDGRETLDRALAWLEGLGRDEPFFLLVHLFDAHGPYRPSAAYAALFQSGGPGRLLSNISKNHLLRDNEGRLILHENRYVDRYDAQIRYLDDLTSRLLERIDRTTTVVVVVGDHGETPGERYHAMDHGGRVFDEQIRIPWILSSAGLRPRRVGGAVETVDLTPTVLDLPRGPAPTGATSWIRNGRFTRSGPGAGS